jgi:hypothetical protein
LIDSVTGWRRLRFLRIDQLGTSNTDRDAGQHCQRQFVVRPHRPILFRVSGERIFTFDFALPEVQKTQSRPLQAAAADTAATTVEIAFREL